MLLNLIVSYKNGASHFVVAETHFVLVAETV